MSEYVRTLPLAIQNNDGHVSIRCTGAPECVWSWALRNGETAANGEGIDAAVKHAIERHGPASVPARVEG